MATCVSYLTLSSRGDEKITYLYLVLGYSIGETMEHRVAAGPNTELAISDELRRREVRTSSVSLLREKMEAGNTSASPRAVFGKDISIGEDNGLPEAPCSWSCKWDRLRALLRCCAPLAGSDVTSKMMPL